MKKQTPRRRRTFFIFFYVEHSIFGSADSELPVIGTLRRTGSTSFLFVLFYSHSHVQPLTPQTICTFSAAGVLLNDVFTSGRGAPEAFPVND
jgi:hypothetical protein